MQHKNKSSSYQDVSFRRPDSYAWKATWEYPGISLGTVRKCRNKETGLSIPWRKPLVVAVYEFRWKLENTNKATTCRGLVAMSTIAERKSAESGVDEKSVGKNLAQARSVEGSNGRRLDSVAKSTNTEVRRGYECRTDVTEI